MQRRLALAAIVAACVGGGPLRAQTYWRVPAAATGGLVGAGVGWMADLPSSDLNSFRGPTLVFTPIGMAAGGVLGYLYGLDADRRLARGDTLRTNQRRWMRIDTFLGCAAAGSLTAFLLINPDRPVVSMSDGEVALLGIGGGTVTGLVLQSHYAYALRPRPRVSIIPRARGVTFVLSRAD